MADTLDAVRVDGTWQSVSSLTGIIAGTAITIQNLGRFPVNVAVAAAQPADTFVGEVVQPYMYPNSVGAVDSGNNEVWVKGDGYVSIQEG